MQSTVATVIPLPLSSITSASTSSVGMSRWHQMHLSRRRGNHGYMFARSTLSYLATLRQRSSNKPCRARSQLLASTHHVFLAATKPRFVVLVFGKAVNHDFRKARNIRFPIPPPTSCPPETRLRVIQPIKQETKNDHRKKGVPGLSFREGGGGYEPTSVDVPGRVESDKGEVVLLHPEVEVLLRQGHRVNAVFVQFLHAHTCVFVRFWRGQHERRGRRRDEDGERTGKALHKRMRTEKTKSGTTRKYSERN